MNLKENVKMMLDEVINAEMLNLFDISKECELPSSCIYKWYKGHETPKLETIMKVFKRFKYTVEPFFKRG